MKLLDLFSGLGGFSYGLERIGFKTVAFCEMDKYCKLVLQKHWKGVKIYNNVKEITKERLEADGIESPDIITGGFPCQPFSHAGVSARRSLGQAHGFACDMQGTLFFDIVRIVKAKRPKALILENVKNLVGHDGGKTFSVIRQTIEEDLGYSFTYNVLDAQSLVPQRRKRCIMVCFRDGQFSDFGFPELDGDPIPLKSILEPNPDPSFTLSDRMWEGHQKRTQRNLERGTGFTAFTADLDKPSNTIVARYYKDGKECLIPQKGKNPRMLTPRECARLQGFPESFVLYPSKTKAFQQFGNAVPSPLIQVVAEKMTKLLSKTK